MAFLFEEVHEAGVPEALDGEQPALDVIVVTEQVHQVHLQRGGTHHAHQHLLQLLQFCGCLLLVFHLEVLEDINTAPLLFVCEVH